MQKIEWTWENEEGEEETISFPARYVVCHDCRGEGKTYLGWAAKDQPAFTREDFEEEGPEFMEDYIDGRYDRDCPACHGQRVVLEIDEEQAEQTMPEEFAAWIQYQRQEAEYRRYCEMERRMGC